MESNIKDNQVQLDDMKEFIDTIDKRIDIIEGLDD
jgi:hypothetical protein